MNTASKADLAGILSNVRRRGFRMRPYTNELKAFSPCNRLDCVGTDVTGAQHNHSDFSHNSNYLSYSFYTKYRFAKSAWLLR
ncbi:hypothetical protein SDC9_152922 [bioreactor metagenome]|uniref:Uncharacterized protein n=1 Tax=bioreactor metagenome TaxID=1076179 RepID=A0A645EUG9_9ZZZZ